MAYKKPEVVAKSEAKQSFVGGCPEKVPAYNYCYHGNTKCLCGPIK